MPPAISRASRWRNAGGAAAVDHQAVDELAEVEAEMLGEPGGGSPSQGGLGEDVAEAVPQEQDPGLGIGPPGAARGVDDAGDRDGLQRVEPLPFGELQHRRQVAPAAVLLPLLPQG